MDPTLQNVVVPTRHYEAAVEFYRDGLGLTVHHEVAGEHCFLDAGGTFVAIHPAGDDEFAPTGRGLYLDVYVEDVDTARERLEAVGAPFENEWEDDQHRGVLVSDPDGNRVEVLEPKTDGS